MAVLALVLVADVGYGWAAASTDRSRLARMIVWQGSDVLDYRRFPALKGDTLLCEAYFNGGGHDATVSSFSIAKPVVSALVGIAIAEGRIGSVDDPITRYLPELAARDPRFARITLRHLLTMSSGLADLDSYYDLDQRATALGRTRIAGPPGRRFQYTT